MNKPCIKEKAKTQSTKLSSLSRAGLGESNQSWEKEGDNVALNTNQESKQTETQSPSLAKLIAIT